MFSFSSFQKNQNPQRNSSGHDDTGVDPHPGSGMDLLFSVFLKDVSVKISWCYDAPTDNIIGNVNVFTF